MEGAPTSRMNFQFDSLRFDTIPDEEFRLTFRPAEKQNVHLLWMEGKKAKHQWTAEIADDVSKYGPVGVPKEALFDFLRGALKERDGGETVLVVAEKGPAGPLATISCTVDQCSKTATLELTVRFTDVWSNVYKFPLQPKEVSKAEVLAAKLRDAEEEIIGLKKEIHALKFRPVVKIQGRQWDGDAQGAYGNTEVGWNPVVQVVNDNGTQFVDVSTGKLRIVHGGNYKLTFDVVHMQPFWPMRDGRTMPIGFRLILQDQDKKELTNSIINTNFYKMTIHLPAGSSVVVSVPSQSPDWDGFKWPSIHLKPMWY